MYDLYAILDDIPGALARFGEALGRAGVSLEGGGVFTLAGQGHAHFLVRDGERARVAAEAASVTVVDIRQVLVRRLDQEKSGELGAIARALADAGVNIVAQYSDHANRLILVVSDMAVADEATAAWAP